MKSLSPVDQAFATQAFQYANGNFALASCFDTVKVAKTMLKQFQTDRNQTLTQIAATVDVTADADATRASAAAQNRASAMLASDNQLTPGQRTQIASVTGVLFAERFMKQPTSQMDGITGFFASALLDARNQVLSGSNAGPKN